MTSTEQVRGALPRFSVTVEQAGQGVLTLTAAGELDLATRGALDTEGARALRQSGDTIVVDLSGVTFCGCAGLESLVELNGWCLACDRTLCVVPSAPVRTAISHTGLDKVLPVAAGA